MKGLLGKKLGMTQIFNEQGESYNIILFLYHSWNDFQGTDIT